MLAYISGALLNAASLDRSRALYERFADACKVAGWEAYNEEMQLEIARRFGDEALLNVWKDTDRIVAERRRRGLL